VFVSTAEANAAVYVEKQNSDAEDAGAGSAATTPSAL
jgi:hypothetical protein